MSNSDPLNAFVMGSVTGGLSTLIFQPFDVTKTRMQDISRHRSAQQTYLQVVSTVYRTEGVKGFWNGLSPALFRCIPGVGMYFCTIQLLKDHVFSEKPTASQSIFMGAAARSAGTTIFMPFTILKTRFESGQYEYRGLFHALNEIKRTEGVRGFTRGLVPTLMRDAPYSGICYMFYTRLKMFLAPENETISSVKIFLCGGAAACLATFVTHPADVVKTYVQLHPSEFSGLIDGFAIIYRRFGYRGYYRGLVVRLTRRTLVMSMSWTVYERINEWLQAKLKSDFAKKI